MEKGSKDSMKIVILNMSDARNKGDLAILESTVGLLRKSYPQSSISLFNIDYSQSEVNRPEWANDLSQIRLESHYGSFFPRVFTGRGTAKDFIRAGLKLIQCLWTAAAVFFLRSRACILLANSLEDKVRELIAADLVIVKGGGYLYSFGGSEQLLYLARHLFPVLLSLRLKKKVLALGHSIGPFHGSLARGWAGFCLRRMDTVVVRDDPSYNLIRGEMGLAEDRAVLLPDLAFWTGPERTEREESTLEYILKKEGIKLNRQPRLYVGLTVRRFRKWHFPDCPDPEQLYQNYINAISQAIEYLAREHGARIFIMPHAREDLPTGEEVGRRSRAADPILLKGNYGQMTLRSLYRRMDFFIATRIHSALFALGEGVPTLAIGYEMPKALGIVGMAWKEDAVLDVRRLTEAGLREKIDQILKEGSRPRRIISQRVINLRHQIETAISRIL